MDYSLLLGVTRRYLRVGKSPGAVAALRPSLQRSSSSEGASRASANRAKKQGKFGGVGGKSGGGGWNAQLSSYAPLLVEGPSQYYMGIIDYMQQWTWSKRLEHFCKASGGVKQRSHCLL